MTRLTEIPDELRAGLPSELAQAELVGTDTAAANESCRLHGPPGTGKSTQSALRVGTLAVERSLTPADMTIVTYRKALAGVVRQRLIDWGVFDEPEVDPAGADSANPFQYWSTIHAAAARSTGFLSDIDSDDPLAGMADEKAKRAFCREMNIQFRPSKPWLETRWTVFADLYGYAKNNLLAVGEWDHVNEESLTPLRADNAAERRLDDFREEWGGASFEEVVEQWEAFKREHDIHDFYEQLEEALVGGLPPLDVLVVDEFHDATPLMSAVTERWVDAADIVVVAGDPDQVVNGYAGASPKFFEDLDDRVEADLPIVKLDRSWRCPDEHFAAAARVLRQERPAPRLTTNGPGQLLRHPGGWFRHTGDEWDVPSPDVNGSPTALWRDYGEDVMFLTRTQKQADGVTAALDAEGIIYRSQPTVGGNWTLRTALMRALDVVENVAPGTSSPSGYARSDLTNFNGSSSAEKDPANYALGPEEARALLSHSHGRYLDADDDEIRETLAELEYGDAEELPLTELIPLTTGKWWVRYTNGRDSIGSLTKLDERDEEAMKTAWDRYDAPYRVSDANGTRVLTIHASKGAEASDVVVYDGITGRISRSLDEDDRSRENEARTWYVALTRASERLHIIRDAFEWTKPYLPVDLEPRAAQAVLDTVDADQEPEVAD